MKNKNFKTICDLIKLPLGRKSFLFMDFGDVQAIKYPQIYKFPINNYYDKGVKNES